MSSNVKRHTSPVSPNGVRSLTELSPEPLTDVLQQVPRDGAEAISLLVRLLDNARHMSPAMVPENTGEVVNKSQNTEYRGIVAQRCEERLSQSGLTRTVESEILTLTEVARMLRCSKAHLCNVLNGKVADLPPLPCVSLGRRKLIRRVALERWLEQLEVTANTDLVQGNR